MDALSCVRPRALTSHPDAVRLKTSCPKALDTFGPTPLACPSVELKGAACRRMCRPMQVLGIALLDLCNGRSAAAMGDEAALRARGVSEPLIDNALVSSTQC